MTLLEEIRDLFSRLDQLSLDELATLRAKIVEYASSEEADADTPESVAILNEVADIGDAAKAKEGEIKAAQEQAAADAKTARERIAKINGEDEGAEGGDEGEGTDAGEGAEGGEDGAEGGEGEGAGDGAEPANAEAVAASGGRRAGTSVSQMARNGHRAQPSPEANAAVEGRTTLVASAALNGFDRGATIPDRYALARGMSRTLERMSKRDRAIGDVVVASAEWQYPEDRILTDDQTRNAEIMDAVTHPMALLATGGICAPVNVDWSLDTWAVADRPLRDGLAAFQASRGGLIYRQPPDIGALAGATGVWTEATDLNPGAATKPVIAIACPGTETVYVEAVSTRLGFGNMESMFDPETVAANTDLAIAAAARIADLNLLSLIEAQCVTDITTAAYLGASRDILRILDQVTAAYRQLHRLSDTQMLTMIVPSWIKNLMRADRVAEIGHDGSSVDPLGITDAYIEALFALRSIKPIFMLDALASGSGYPTQNFAAFANSSAVPAWPDELVATLFVEGSVQFLDGGRLDLGVVRDSTLDATNDYETFVETFEAIANRGFTASALQLVIEVVPNGATAGTVTPTAWS